MKLLSRRDFHMLTLTPLSMSLFGKKLDSTVAGVRIGAQSYSFRDRSLDAMIQAMASLRLGGCELWQGHVEPRLPDAYGAAATDNSKREALRKWRETVSLDHFRNIRRKFDDAGITLYAYDYSFRDDYSELEISRGFEMAQALGVQTMVASSTLTMAERLDLPASRAGIRIGMHGHSNTRDPNEFSSAASFERAMSACSAHIGVALDIGHFVAAGGDPLPFLEKHHARIYAVHIKDRKKNQGPNVPWGQGDTPIRPVLQSMKTHRYNIPVEIEYAYAGGDSQLEVGKCLEYTRHILS